MNNESSPVEAPADFASTLDALEETVRRLEEGQLGLEDSVALFQRGMELSRHAETQLLTARQTVEILLGEDALPTPLTQEEDV
ncbi:MULTISPECIES: exodeoxyribonuclease VII small subunit [Acidithiobacillus]|uniref:Exodeoxyribonuclease 7 small subunit n=2 Tax=Acidithiobacillus TaxID=119977 RepID=A0A179BP98_ACIFR|nr:MULTISPECIES: exodeoxyribonuclease VII small subunit [Acidithiobacillus]MDA8181857.1 exodeoxyribonuclease VII small subunit [Acidithiobacillus sp.]MBU2830736.1 exodeoxyribonuclease VII small subunit [Acidithiobacillus ferriphilus]MBU2832177.1 exodeoxyribonuclease VII small subunit [Acidithiobacillus ferriphilus]MBU2855163.1 exodeoxyribonuclease VII small subunit [Acidithiobacillus ferriphilus]MBW9248142.1 exodeoxyribonuclease VII small subunit [Acidithiobacillus ferriphilus]